MTRPVKFKEQVKIAFLFLHVLLKLSVDTCFRLILKMYF